MRWLLIVAVISMSTLSMASALSAADSIFPDKNLEAVVRQYVFEKRNNEEPLVEEDVIKISTIVGKDKGIKDLTGLEKCRDLRSLDLEGNEIENIEPLKDLTLLQSVNLAKNKIQDIKPLAGLAKLQYLELSNNSISDLAPIAGLEAMRSLYLSKNQIKELKPLQGLSKLWSLYLDGNQIEDLKPLADLKKLDSLDLRNNAVADLSPLKGLTEWKYLMLDHNKITDLTVLIEMAKKDQAESQRFAPFWNVYLSGNPLSKEAQEKQLEELKKMAKKVVLE